MKVLKKKKSGVILGLVTVAAAITTALTAYAYFTTTGTGSGAAAVGTTSTITLHGTTQDALFPGTSTEVDFTVDNPSPGHQWVHTVHLDSVSTDAAHSSCDTGDFTMPDVTADQDFPSGSGQAVTATGTLTFNNTSVSQNGCQGAPLTLHLSSN